MTCSFHTNLFENALSDILKRLPPLCYKTTKNKEPIDGFRMRKPGAVHHARFMSKTLYILKMVMLGYIIPVDIMSLEKRMELDRMALFCSPFFTPCFLQARLSISSPRLDLGLWKDMCRFEVILIRKCCIYNCC
jgi:hypothetical protein